ncbi:lipoprotein insertase outer membrane protein LolB [Marinicella litoralis]|uniref:Outer-membrane lipoprotein LolB n=1 Tax=Marinicella litoralis TaxID=644220 RepID=A0A4R6XX94_9GAMM|nr:lipoprotein insertase outer membrane protein LolB [Marinicella litoralis]TDR23209.1 outer membrane lipoprotein LolB [Marinicella litoralis]
MKRFVYLLLLIALCSIQLSCSSNRQLKPGALPVITDLSTIQEYTFNGKMSFSDGVEGGSGQVSWNQNHDRIAVTLKAPLSNKSWTLIDAPGHAEIQLSNGETIYGLTAGDLISEQIGWDLPWKDLQAWVIGQKSPSGRILNKHTNGDFEILDQGWFISYSKIKTNGNGIVPHKIIARKDPYSIKLIIKNWQW